MGKTTESKDPKVSEHKISVSHHIHLYMPYSVQYIIDSQCVCRIMDG